MPLFVFISGYLFTNSIIKNADRPERNSFLGKNGFLIKKTLRLMVPYIVISSLVFIPKVYLSRFSLRPVALSLNSYIEMLIFPGKNVIIFFWFLPTIFIISIFSFFLWKYFLVKSDSGKWAICVLFFLGLTFFNPFEPIKILNISGVAHYFFYFILGISFHIYEKEISGFLFTKYNIKIIILLTIHLAVVYFSIASPAYDKIIIFVAVIGIIESIILGHLYILHDLKFLNHLNGSTYSIFLFSWFPQVIIQFFILKYISVPWYFSSIVSTIFGIYLPFMFFRLLNYIKKLNEPGRIVSVILGN